MANHLSAPRVETRTGTPAAGGSERRAYRDAGLEFDRLMRSCVGTLAGRCTTIPEARRQAIKDFARPDKRPATMVVVGANLAAIAADPSLPDGSIEGALLPLEAWLRTHRPTSSLSLVSEWTAETRAQAPADVDQGLALNAILTGDRTALERAIDSTTQHIASARRLLTALMQAQQEAMYRRAERRYA